jgi:hypothetical protein
MKYRLFLGMGVLLLIIIAGCSDKGVNSIDLNDKAVNQRMQAAPGTAEIAPVAEPALDQRRSRFNFRAYFNETTNGGETPLKGKVSFNFDSNLRYISYSLSVFDVQNISEILVFSDGGNKTGFGAVLRLYPLEKVGEANNSEYSGLETSGKADAKQLMGPLQDKSLKYLLALMDSGDASVRIITSRNPDGAIQGHIF